MGPYREARKGEAMSEEKLAQDHEKYRPPVLIYTDGACSPNPGPGGWGALLISIAADTGEVIERELSGHDRFTTNNRMEMMAAIQALEALTQPSTVTLYTDSKILQLGAKGAWKRKANKDLWRRLDEARATHIVRWEWVKGHNGHPENERADQLAGRAMRTSR